MKSLLIIFPLIVICSCKSTVKREAFDFHTLVGEWRLDSSSNRLFSRDRLIILEDSNWYLFSGSDGGSLISKGRWLGSDSLISDHYDDLTFKIIDSNHLHLAGGWNNNENFYKRIESEDYRDQLKQYLRQDSLRTKVIGWWKLVKAKMPVKLVNYSGYYEQFTLNIQEDGDAIFYLENKLDSTVDYSYHMNVDGIDFNRGCVVGSGSKISFDTKGSMKLLLDQRRGDTLLLERITEIK